MSKINLSKIKPGIYYTIFRDEILMLADIVRYDKNSYSIEFISLPSNSIRFIMLTKDAMLKTIKRSKLIYLGEL